MGSQLVNLKMKEANLPGTLPEKPVLHKIGQNAPGSAVGSLVIVSDQPFADFYEYLLGYKDYKLLADNTERGTGFHVWWGSYTKTKGAETELYDALNLIHNGWAGGIVDKVGAPAMALGQAAAKAAGLIKTQYFVSFSLSQTVLPRQNDYMVRLHGPVPQTTFGEIAANLCALDGKGALKNKTNAKAVVLDAIDFVVGQFGG